MLVRLSSPAGDPVSEAVRFRVLGPLEVAVGDRLVHINGRRQRELLALLLVRANRLVSLETLVGMAWKSGVPATARRQTQNSVGRLRRVLVEGGAPVQVIQTQPGGYLLCADDAELDALVFADLVGNGRRAAREGNLELASAKLRGALSLWRGKALAEFDGELVWSEAARLEEQRVSVLEECLELELRQGRHHELIGELTALVQEHPLRERLWSQLVLALYRDGRRGDALAACRRARATLAAELGLDPGPELRRLEAAVLAGDKALEPARGRATSGVPRPCQLPPDVPEFTGRDGIARDLEALFRRGQAGNALTVVTIAGTAGVGKTALAVHMAHRLRDVCPDGRLFVNLGGTSDQRADPAEVLARFLRALGVPGTEIPEGAEERAEIFRERLADRRMLVLLDNAADEGQIRLLLPGGSGNAVLVTSRSRLTGLSGARQVGLDVLAPEDAVGMVARIVGTDRVPAGAAAAGELVGLCGRLPLALRIAGARLAARPHWTLERMVGRLADERRRLDELAHGDLEVRASLSLGYRHLDQGARRLFHLLGMLRAPDFPSWVCAALLDTGVPAAEELLDRLVDAHMVDVTGSDAAGQVRYRFHDLVRLYARERAEEEAAAERTAAATRVLGAWMALVERAHRILYGGDFAILHSSAPRWPQVLEQLASTVDADPLTWYETERLNVVAAVRQAADTVLDAPGSNAALGELCWDLSATAVSLFLIRGHYEDWESTLTRSLAVTRLIGDQRGTAAMLTGLGWLDTYRHRYAHADKVLAEALGIFQELGDDHGLALTLPMVAHIDGMRGRYDAAVARHGDALDALRRIGDRGAEAFVLRSLGQVLAEAGRHKEALPYLERALEQSHMGSPRAHAEALCWLGESYLGLDDIERAEAMFLEMRTVAVRVGDLRGQAGALHGMGLIRLREGALAAALELLDRALVLTERVGRGRLEARIRLALGRLRHRRREYDEAVPHLEQAARIFEALGSPVWHAQVLAVLKEVRQGTAAVMTNL